jgi:hypothetical protein
VTFSNAQAVSTRTGDALLMTEFGATNDASTLTEDVAAAASAKVGWMMVDDPTGMVLVLAAAETNRANGEPYCRRSCRAQP